MPQHIIVNATPPSSTQTRALERPSLHAVMRCLFMCTVAFYCANRTIVMSEDVRTVLRSLYKHYKADEKLSSQVASLLVARDLIGCSVAVQDACVRAALNAVNILIDATPVRYGGDSLW